MSGEEDEADDSQYSRALQDSGIVIGPSRTPKDFFAVSQALIDDPSPSLPRPFRTFSTKMMAFHLNYDPDISRMPVDKAAEVFNISDLRPALADFLL